MIRDVATGKQLVSPMRHPKPVTSVAFSPDGKWVVTICADRAARVWNAATGDPVTPPLRHLATLIRATFLPDNRRIVTADADGHAWVWDLPLDNTPVADLALLAHFLSGDTVTPEGVSPEQQLASLQALWQRLRASYPSAFTVSTEQIVAWHEFQARESELAEKWFAAKFHWQQLLTLRPGDQAFAEHLKHAQDRLQAER
jgi:hypothetical protein